MTDTNAQQPGMIASHAQYAKGVAESTIGNVTGSEAWKKSGEQDQAAGVDAMKQAGENRDSTQGYGKVEEMAGKAVGCQGMEKEGANSRK
ncbi:hypothetical protein HRG_001168 [Hirsutella rhossiliensis]|uniref:Mismatched base pair and cruciform DNA recognition protein n=1 Tax=Hirsutella rhossiliensis TaxID=111463 RepID=A0A9P8SPT1_9HYPO|nr:uncharacterized protein HRG_01168 [Hirsutella rhossiliensis]KAH0968526.1 hypothetical protein HRG_01168 [Hirsutella rhossiliensis]